MSRYDRGRSALLFAKFYTWLVGPSLFPNFGPEPSFDAYVLDMDRWVYKGIEYKTNCKELQNNTQGLVDVNTKGNATFFELNRMRMARIGYLRTRSGLRRSTTSLWVWQKP
ncbi:hypothetical protein L596_025737 [Steinernema carpocapsae]|uniref:Uncharacterized protein n=1 Tax=Steinernema carpocapsae TaxID=34508 RepID=A0A4U5M8P7_STECR|nr:hypothetical protein L596_025737 [Steinernema carpocapsae]